MSLSKSKQILTSEFADIVKIYVIEMNMNIIEMYMRVTDMKNI